MLYLQHLQEFLVQDRSGHKISLEYIMQEQDNEKLVLHKWQVLEDEQFP